VLTGRHAALETWWHEYTDEDRARAASLLDGAGFGGEAFGARSFGLLHHLGKAKGDRNP